MTIRLAPKPRTISQSRRVCPDSRGRAMMSKTMAEVMSRNQTIAVGGTRVNRVLAMAAPNCTETIPVVTSHAAGIRFVTRTEPLCQTLLRQKRAVNVRYRRTPLYSWLKSSCTQSLRAVHGMHAMYSANIPRCVGILTPVKPERPDGETRPAAPLIGMQPGRD